MIRFSKFKLAILTSVCLAACSTHAPSKMTENKIRVEPDRYVEESLVSEMHASEIKALAQHYVRHGDGALDLAVTYDPRSGTNASMKASEQASKIVDVMRAQGVENVNARIMPVKDSGPSKVLITYNGYEVLPPEDCGMLSGYHGRQVEAEEDYELGCTIDTLLAKQIVRPKDLAGQDNTDYDTDGRRAANITEIYRSGAPSGDLNGESASGG